MKGKQAGWIVLLAAIFSIGGALLIRSMNSTPLPDEKKNLSVESSTTMTPNPEEQNPPKGSTPEEVLSPAGNLLIHITAGGKDVAEATIIVNRTLAVLYNNSTRVPTSKPPFIAPF